MIPSGRFAELENNFEGWSKKIVARHIPDDYSVNVVFYLRRLGICYAAQRRKSPDSS